MIDKARMDALLLYRPETGDFLWKVYRARGAKPGFVAGHVNSDGYVIVGVDRAQYYAHHLVWFAHHGEWPTNQIDHIDEDKSNNRVANLRLSDYSLNMHNQRMARAHSGTHVRGVQAHGPSYRATITVNHVVHRLGTFQTIEEASEAYLTAKKRMVKHV